MMYKETKICREILCGGNMLDSFTGARGALFFVSVATLVILTGSFGGFI
jgi:hypothetical protein